MKLLFPHWTNSSKVDMDELIDIVYNLQYIVGELLKSNAIILTLS